MQHLDGPPVPAGQYNDAAFTLVQLRKILEDSTGSGSARNPEMQQLQQACASCTADLDAVSASRAALHYPAPCSRVVRRQT